MRIMLSIAAALSLLAAPSPASAAPRTVTLSVPGMNCAACPITIKKALMKVAGVQKVEVSYEKLEAIVTYDDAKTNVDALTNATKRAGYPSSEKVAAP
jgi:mercuric ion binding protein